MKSSIPTRIHWITGTYLVAGLFLWCVWLATGNEAWIRYFFDYAGSLFFVGIAGLELYFGVLSCLQFAPGEPLRRAWGLIAAGSVCRLAGLIAIHFLGGNPSLASQVWLMDFIPAQSSLSLRKLGLALSGPVHMMLLAGGLFQVLRVYRRMGLATRLKLMDRLLLTLVFAFTLRQGYEVVASLYGSTAPFTLYQFLSWITNPLLSLLLLEAVLIRRYVIHMGRSLIARCWGAYAYAIFATSLGNMGMWAASHQYIPWPLSSVSWYVWFIVSAAFALGPAYQIEAFRRANKPVQVVPPNDLSASPNAKTRAARM